MNSKLIMKYPSSWHRDRYREGIFLGNGITGAVVLGSIWDETITFSDTDLLYNCDYPELPDVSHVLPEIREKLLNNKPFEADQIMKNELEKEKYSPKSPLPLPICDLKILTETKKGFKNYRRNLDMHSGQCDITWDDGDKNMYRKCFISRSEEIFVMEIGTANNMPITAEFHFALPDHANAVTEVKDFKLPQNIEITAQGNTFTFCAQNEDGTDFGTVGVVENIDGNMTSTDGKITIENFTKATIKVKTFIKGDRKQVPEIISSLKAAEKDYDRLLQEHEVLHSGLMNSSSLNLFSGEGSSNEELLLDAYQGEASLEMLEKMWMFGKYLLVSGSSEKSNPCALCGIWSVDYVGFWAFNMINENLQMIYWQALSGNMPELLIPVFNYMDRLMDDFRTNAKNLYGCRGIFIPAPTTPNTGIIKICFPHILHWTGGAGWIAQHYYDYYLATQDEEFLLNRCIPFLKEVALFYEDYFVEDPQGYYMIMPSNSPENTPGNYWSESGEKEVIMETTINATMDFAISKEVFTNLISACKILNVENENVLKWEKILSKIPPYQINEDGAIKEWMHDFYKDNYRHRHQSHLYPLFPGNEIHRLDEDTTLYDACVVAAKKRLSIGINQQSGWSLVHLANNYARCGEGDLAIECLDLMCKSIVMNNFATLHNDYREMGIGVKMPRAPMQLDANMGIVSAINEMLIQSYDDKILILPALPQRLKKGEVKNLLTRQGIEVSVSWDDGKIDLTLKNNHSEKEITLIFPNGEKEKLIIGKNQVLSLKR